MDRKRVAWLDTSFGCSPAQATKPACVGSAVGIPAVDAQLDQGGIHFGDLGTFLAALNDPSLFTQLNGVFCAVVGSEFKR